MPSSGYVQDAVGNRLGTFTDSSLLNISSYAPTPGVVENNSGGFLRSFSLIDILNESLYLPVSGFVHNASGLYILSFGPVDILNLSEYSPRFPIDNLSSYLGVVDYLYAGRHPVKTGIGDGSALQVKLHAWNVGNKTYWSPQIRRGWYYLGGLERYLFASEGYYTTTTSPGIVTFATPDLTYPSTQGPILVEGNLFSWTQMGSPLAVYRAITPTASGATRLFLTIPGELYALTDATGAELVSVPGSSYVLDRNVYYWDGTYAWITRAATDPDRLAPLYATYRKEALNITQEELLVVDSDGNLRTMLDRVAFGDEVYNPKLTLPGSGAIAVQSVSGNAIVPAVTLTPGQRLGVLYAVDGSFSLIDNGDGTSTLQGFRLVPDTVQIRWEAADKIQYLDVGQFPVTDPSYVQINPLLDGVGDGFLYLAEGRHPATTLTNLDVTFAPANVPTDTREHFTARVVARDSSNRPLGNVAVSAVILLPDGVSTRVMLPLSNTTGEGYTNFTGGLGVTDFTGTAHFWWQAYGAPIGAATLTVYAGTADGTVVTTTKTFGIVLSRVRSGPSAYMPKVIVYLSPNQDAEGLQTVYLYLTNQAGAPYRDPLSVQITCVKGALFPAAALTASGTGQGTQSLTVPLSPGKADTLQRFTTCRYRYAPKDTLLAYPLDTEGYPALPIHYASTPLVP